MLSLIFIGLGSLSFFLALIYWCYKYQNHYKGLPLIPQLPPLIPLLGNVLVVKNATEAYWILHNALMKYGEGKVMRGSLGFIFAIHIGDPELLEYVMTHTSAINKSTLYKPFKNWLGTGLLTSSGEKWRSRRKLLTHAYHFKILEQFIDVFDKNSAILIRKLQTNVGKEKTDVYPFITLCALDTICETAMGTSVNAQENEISDFVSATKQMNRIIVSRAISIFKQFDFTYQFTKDYQIEKNSLETLHNYTLSIINLRRKELLNAKAIASQSEGNKQEDDNEIGYKKKIPFLDLLLQSSINGEPLTDEDIKEEVNTFMFEGHDTVSAAMSFCIYCIARNPQVQEKLIGEQREIYGRNPERETTFKDIQEMRYLEMTIKETLRLYPSVPVFGRIVSEDMKHGDMKMKNGLSLGIGVYTLHRNPEYYPEPDAFIPERFTPENNAKRHPFAYLPFSAGFRNCVGQKFAMLEMKSTISKLLRNFQFKAVPDFEVRLSSEIILRSSNGVVVAIDTRVW